MYVHVDVQADGRLLTVSLAHEVTLNAHEQVVLVHVRQLYL